MKPTLRIHKYWQVAQSSPASQNLPKSMAASTMIVMKIKKHEHTTMYMTIMLLKSHRMYSPLAYTKTKLNENI